MYQFFRRCYPLYDFMLSSQIDGIITQLKEAKSDTLRIEVIENFLLINLRTQKSQELIKITVEIIKKHAGDIKIMVLADQLHVSQSQLEKRFRNVVGASPKKFASIVRLRNVLETAPNYDSMTKLGLQAGYFDQAHFIRDFKSFTGITPERYFKRK